MLSLEPLIEITLYIPLILLPVYLLLLAGVVVGGFQLYRRFSDCRQHEVEWQTAQEGYRTFIYNIGHDVSSPLQTIQAHLDNIAVVGQDLDNPWQQRHALISDEIQRLKRLTDNLKQLALLETPNKTRMHSAINLNALVEQVIINMAETAEARRVELKYLYPKRPLRVFGDQDRLYQLFANLVDNGIKYAKADGGSVVISVNESQTGGRLHIRVSDDGIGIAEMDLLSIFETAYRTPSSYLTRRNGSGLGLTIASRIVEQHGGTLRVQSKLHEGSQFYFDLLVANSTTQISDSGENIL